MNIKIVLIIYMEGAHTHASAAGVTNWGLGCVFSKIPYQYIYRNSTVGSKAETAMYPAFYCQPSKSSAQVNFHVCFFVSGNLTTSAKHCLHNIASNCRC